VRDNRALVSLERMLFVVGITCLCVFGLVTAGAAIYQRERAAAFDKQRAIGSLPAAPAQVQPAVAQADDSLIGMLDIPRLELTTPIVEGDDRATLEIAAGHLPDTPRPWELGNSAIAAHRDGLFRPLEDIRVGDQVIVRTMRGDFEYRVRDTKIVQPDDLSVLAPTEHHTLTLITCYPFAYIGNAPKRFIVHADRVTAPPPQPQPTVVPASLHSTPETSVAKPAAKPPKPKAKRKVRAPLKATAPAKVATTLKTTTTKEEAEQAVIQTAGERPKSRNFFTKIAGVTGVKKIASVKKIPGVKKIAGLFKGKRDPASTPKDAGH
jgi:sortase A